MRSDKNAIGLTKDGIEKKYIYICQLQCPAYIAHN
jgi:hypothetical protein